ncbi:ABC transporter permease [Sneathiella sp.]|uniref:ABC transporter permease n=1 Tax=Sneathiella sp. TaxID=1964365 RepID=UPI0039E62D15
MALADQPYSLSSDKGRRLPWGRWSSTAFSMLVAALVSIPVVVIFGFLFVPFGDIWSHLASTVLPVYLMNTVILALGVAVLVLSIGVSTAWLVTMYEFPARKLFSWALFLPLAMPAYIIAYTYTGMFDFAGPVQSFVRDVFDWGRQDYWFPPVRSIGGAILMLGLVLYPYVYLVARAAFLEQSICALEVGRTLGKGPIALFFKIALPLARPAIVTGLALALMETLSDFGTVQYFAVDTFTTGIYRTWLGMGEAPAAAQLAAMLMGFVFLLVVLERVNRGKKKYFQTTGRYQEIRRKGLTGGKRMTAFIVCFMPIFFGFLLPSGWLLNASLSFPESILNSHFPVLAGSSIIVAALASVAALVISMLLVYSKRQGGPKKTTFIKTLTVRIAAMGYAIPGPVLAVGILIPFGFADNAVDGFFRSQFGISTGLILSGTLFALMFAYVVRFLAVSMNTVESSVEKVTPNMDRAARTMGVTGLQAIWRVHVPIISGSLMTALLLVFVDVMKELPATLIMRPFGFETLAVRAYELASDERLAEAAGPSLAIVLVGVLPVIILSRAISRSRPGQAAGLES